MGNDGCTGTLVHCATEERPRFAWHMRLPLCARPDRPGATAYLTGTWNNSTVAIKASLCAHYPVVSNLRVEPQRVMTEHRHAGWTANTPCPRDAARVTLQVCMTSQSRIAARLNESIVSPSMQHPACVQVG